VVGGCFENFVFAKAQIFKEITLLACPSSGFKFKSKLETCEHVEKNISGGAPRLFFKAGQPSRGYSATRRSFRDNNHRDICWKSFR
jgi:hypothetical protein